MPLAVLAAIGGGALLATGGSGAVVIGVSARERARSVIVEIAEPGDMVAMSVVVMMAVVATILVRLRSDRRGNHGRNQGCGAEQFHSGHHFSSWRYVTRTDQGKTGS